MANLKDLIAASHQLAHTILDVLPWIEQHVQAIDGVVVKISTGAKSAKFKKASAALEDYKPKNNLTRIWIDTNYTYSIYLTVKDCYSNGENCFYENANIQIATVDSQTGKAHVAFDAKQWRDYANKLLAVTYEQIEGKRQEYKKTEEALKNIEKSVPDSFSDYVRRGY